MASGCGLYVRTKLPTSLSCCTIFIYTYDILNNAEAINVKVIIHPPPYVISQVVICNSHTVVLCYDVCRMCRQSERPGFRHDVQHKRRTGGGRRQEGPGKGEAFDRFFSNTV